MSNIWVWSDPHAYHKNILKLGKGRPFASIEEMNEFLIVEHNKLVKPGDDVYCLGDVAMADLPKTEKFLKSLNGNKFLIRGNHDKQIQNSYQGFGWIKDYYETTIDGTFVCMSHYPFLEWNRSFHGSIHLSGHTHSSEKIVRPNRKGIHVGVDAWDFKPVSWSQIKALADTITKDNNSL